MPGASLPLGSSAVAQQQQHWQQQMAAACVRYVAVSDVAAA